MYDMLDFATQYRAALDIMTADCNMNLCKFKLTKKEWGMASELSKVLQVSFFFFFLCYRTNLPLNVRFLSMAPYFFHTMHPTSAPLSQLWTTSMITWKKPVRTSSFRRPSVPLLLSEIGIVTGLGTRAGCGQGQVGVGVRVGILNPPRNPHPWQGLMGLSRVHYLPFFFLNYYLYINI